MESCLDSGTGTVGQVWRQFPELRRSERLQKDLVEIGALSSGEDPSLQPITTATEAYCRSIKLASNVNDGTPLLGHLYVRYFAGCFCVLSALSNQTNTETVPFRRRSFWRANARHTDSPGIA